MLQVPVLIVDSNYATVLRYLVLRVKYLIVSNKRPGYYWFREPNLSEVLMEKQNIMLWWD